MKDQALQLILARMYGRELLHSIRVGDSLTGTAAVVGYLHDVVEGDFATLEEIREQFGDAVAQGVDAVTRRDGEIYADFIERAAQDPVGRVVKLADVKDNLRDLPRGFSLRKRYEKALFRLQSGPETAEE
ncbi:MAG: GTP pyrophosphokinase [Myxococcales bacterium]|nr:GTP pyrophosphokinase [Myxococcales bacterium]